MPITVPVLGRTFHWWSGYRVRGEIPRRVDLDLPFSISDRLHMATLIAPGPTGPTIAIYGTRLAEMDGTDRTGRSVDALPTRLFPNAADMIVGLLHDGVAPRLCRGIQINPAWPGRAYVMHTCFLPIRREDGQREVLGVSAVGEEVRSSESYRLEMP